MRVSRFLQIFIVLALVAVNIVTFDYAKKKVDNSYEATLRDAWMQGRVDKAVARSNQLYSIESEEFFGRLRGAQDAPVEEEPIICNDTYKEGSTYTAELVNVEIPQPLRPEEFVKVEITLKNTGDIIWYGESYACDNYPKIRLGDIDAFSQPHQLWNDFNFKDNGWLHNEFRNRVGMQEKQVRPGKKGTFTFWIETPALTHTQVVETIKNEETDKETELIKGFDWAYEKYTFSPVIDGVWMDLDIRLILKLGQLPPAEADKIRFISSKKRNFALADFFGEKNLYLTLKQQIGYLRYGENAFHSYIISSGRYDTPTPVGDYTIYNKQETRIGGKSPYYRMPYWMGLRDSGGSFRGYGLHEVPYLGESRETSKFYDNGLNYDLGRAVSHGCVRSGPDDAAFAFEFGELDMPVYVRAE